MDAHRRKSARFPRAYKLCPNYDTMFSDTRSRNRLQRNPFIQTSQISAQPTLKSTADLKQNMEIQGSHRALFYRQPSRKHISSYSTVVVNLEGSPKKVSFEEEKMSKKSSVVITLPVKSEKMVSRGTQTDYRESEAQTLPWRHEIKAQGNLLAELLSLDWFDFEKNYPPGVEEAMLIEKSRQKLAWENIIERLKGKENERKRKLLVLKMAENELAFKDEQKNEENRERLEMSRRLMKAERETMEEKLWLKLQKSYTRRRRENDFKIKYWNHELARKIRKMKSGRLRPSAKRDIIALHLDKSSDLYAPKLRDGENPSLRHEVIDIHCRYLKRFHGLEVLEKHIAAVLHPKFLKCPFEALSFEFKKLQLCPRKFRERVVKEPRKENFDGSSLRVPVPVPASTPEPSPPKAIGVPDGEERLYQASLLIGKIIKGRSIQTKKILKFYKMA